MVLLLQNGQVFEGKSVGEAKETIGEIVFSTGMTGYLGTITDPGFYAQIVVETFPMIGNYGMIEADLEAKKPALSGYIVGEICDEPSNFRSEGRLADYLKKESVACLSGVDTRALTKVIRESGVMNAAILHNLDRKDEVLKELANFSTKNAVEQVSCKEISREKPANPKRSVVLWDFGTKESIIKELLKRDCEVIRVPSKTTAKEILEIAPDGVILSSGPGDPRNNPELIKEVRYLCQAKIPIFGICLGHLLLALSQGAVCEKLKYGHRGGNQPVKDNKTGRLYVTSQNHGYTILNESLPEGISLRFQNANDASCEGISLDDMPAFSVQFHPEAGPQDTEFLFDEFIDLMDANR